MDTVVLRGDGGGDYMQALRSAANESDGCARRLCLRHGFCIRLQSLFGQLGKLQ